MSMLLACLLSSVPLAVEEMENAHSRIVREIGNKQSKLYCQGKLASDCLPFLDEESVPVLKTIKNKKSAPVSSADYYHYCQRKFRTESYKLRGLKKVSLAWDSVKKDLEN